MGIDGLRRIVQGFKVNFVNIMLIGIIIEGF